MKDLTTLSGDALTAALALDFDTLDSEALTAALTEQRAAGDIMFARTAPSLAQVREAVAVKTSVKSIEAELASREAEVEAAAAEFAAARAEFSLDEPEADADAEDDETDEDDAEVDGEIVEAAADDEDELDDKDADKEDDDKPKFSARDKMTITAAAAARKVGKANKRPARLADKPVIITAAGENLGVSMGSRLADHEQVGKAWLKKVESFPTFSKTRGQHARSASGGVENIQKHDLATFGLNVPAALSASGGNGPGEHKAVRNALALHEKALVASLKASEKGGTNLRDAMTAAGWCAPSEPVYSYIADYVVDGLLTLPQVGAPRGGLLMTTGPARSSQGAALTDFGFIQTEAQAEAGTVKTLESIVCPDFVDHRLDAIGYGYTIPFLTQKAYPELIADTLKFAGVLWAHKLNARRISQILALADARTFAGYGPSTTDTLEVFTLIALHERRKWNLGRRAIIEVKVPEIALEIFRADMSRRTGLALDDVATEQKINAHFAARGLAVEYLADWAELVITGGVVALPATFPAVMYPSGTFVEAVEEVVNLKAIYDAASITVNEYTGVFYEQGQMIAKAGYSASKLTIPVNTAGESGALTLMGPGTTKNKGPVPAPLVIVNEVPAT